jgi:hypothetical protein
MKKILLSSAFLICNLVVAQTTQNDGDWDDTNTWGGTVPNSTANIVIAHDVDVDDDRSCNTLTINSGARLDVEASLTVATTSVNNGTLYITLGDLTLTAGNFTNNGSLRIYGGRDLVFSSSSTTLTNTGAINLYSTKSAFGSLLLSGTYTETGSGNIAYSRYVAGTDYWDLIGSPLSNYAISDFIFNNSGIATNGSSPTVYALGYYTNTSGASSTNDGWTNYTSSTTGAAGNLISGRGYQMATTAAATGAEVTFEGTLLTGDVARTLTTNEAGNASASDGTKFELIANPYPSYISVTSFVDAHKNTQMHSAHAAVYGWDGVQYDTYNLAAPGNNIAPGQGFMVGVRGSAGDTQTYTFTTAMQTATGTGDYNEYDVMEDRAELFVSLDQNNASRQTKLIFLNEGTDGLDIGYDAGTLDIANNTIYSRLVSEDEGIDMSIQSLSFAEVNDKVIPLGINAEAGLEATISISHNTTNPSTYVYLEDALEGTFTDLKETDFVITPDSDLEGLGRFFIHTSATTMSNEDESTNLLNVFKLQNNNFITIEGLATQSNETSLRLYNLLGNQVLSTTLGTNINTQTISTNGLATGIYVIKLESGNEVLTKKLIIQ